MNLKRAAAAVTAIAILLCTSGCSALSKLADGAPAGEFFAAARADIVGVPEQSYTKVSVSLPRHSGYAYTEDKFAFAALENEEQRDAYRAIEESLFCVTDEAGGENGRFALRRAFIPTLSSAEIFMAKEAVLADHPEVFWTSGSYTIGYNMHDGYYITMYTDYSADEIAVMASAMQANIALTLREIPSGLTEYDRELIIHDCLVRDVAYDRAAAEMPERFTIASTSYGAMVNRTAVCSGYAWAAKLLLNRVGISCTTVKGVSGGFGHMWNLVSIDGKWYHLDVTWDDPSVISSGSEKLYDYFNLTDELIATDHEIAENYDKLTEELIRESGGTSMNFFNFVLPECDSLKANYYQKNSVELTALDNDNSDIVSSEMLTAAALREGMLYFSFPESMDCEVIELWMGEALGKAQLKVNRMMPEEHRISKCWLSIRSGSETGLWSHVYRVIIEYSGDVSGE